MVPARYWAAVMYPELLGGLVLAWHWLDENLLVQVGCSRLGHGEAVSSCHSYVDTPPLVLNETCDKIAVTESVLG
jgi:hypothetical protein